MKIYISGKITGRPIDEYTQQFAKAELKLHERFNCVTINPTCLPLGLKYPDYIKVGLVMLDSCDAIYMLKGWKESAGARYEHSYAKLTGKVIIYESN